MVDRFVVHEIAGGDVEVWHDPTGEVFMRTTGKNNSPIELNVHQATELAELLMRLVREIEEAGR